MNNATQNLNKTVQQPAAVVPNVVDTTQQAVNDVNKTANDAVADVDKTVGGLLKP